MQKKFVSEYKYWGLGFPILLKDIEFLQIEGQWQLQIDVKEIANDAFHNIIKKATESSLTGKEIEFLRMHLKMTKKEFAEKLNVHRKTIARWEKAGHKPPKMVKNYDSVIQSLVIPSS